MRRVPVFFAVVIMFAAGAVADDVARPWSGESELSMVQNAGNTVSSSLLVKQTLVYDVRPWRNTLKLEASNVSSEVLDPASGRKVSVRTGEMYYLTEQLDRFITEKNYAFFRSTYEKDRFSGFDHQSTSVLGYGRSLFDSPVFAMKAELGLGSSTDELDECERIAPLPGCGRTDSSKLLYVSETLLWHISKPAELGQDLSIEDTDSNRISRFTVYLKSQLISSLATKLGYSIKYTDVVPADKKHKDEELSASLVYSF